MHAAATTRSTRLAESGPSDADLLRRFDREGDESAFASVVARHAALVRGAAGRRVGGDADAEDVTQAAFVVLARRPERAARSAAACGSAGPWLLRACHFAAKNAMRRDRRRRHHERAALEHRPPDAGADPSAVLAWREVRPVLDECLLRLGDADLAAVTLRHVEGRPTREVAAALGVSLDAAKQRVSRATRRLRGLLERRGVTVPSAALATALAARAAVPVHNPAALSAAALSPAATAAALSQGVATAMFFTPTKIALALAAAAAGVATTAAVSTGGAGPVAVASPTTAPAAQPGESPSLRPRRARAESVLAAVGDYFAANGRFPPELADAAPYWQGDGEFPSGAYAYREPADAGARLNAGDVVGGFDRELPAARPAVHRPLPRRTDG